MGVARRVNGSEGDCRCFLDNCRCELPASDADTRNFLYASPVLAVPLDGARDMSENMTHPP